jgi:hypothetical protein
MGSRTAYSLSRFIIEGTEVRAREIENYERRTMSKREQFVELSGSFPPLPSSPLCFIGRVSRNPDNYRYVVRFQDAPVFLLLLFLYLSLYPSCSFTAFLWPTDTCFSLYLFSFPFAIVAVVIVISNRDKEKSSLKSFYNEAI